MATVSLLLYLLPWGGSAVGQQLLFRPYTRASGLPSDYILHLYQDRQGYMWFATDHGVSRYDGARFQNLSTANGLPANLVYTVFQDSRGHYWFGMFERGAIRYDGRKFDAALIANRDATPASTLSAFSFEEDNYGRVYALTDVGLFVYENNSWRKLPLPTGNALQTYGIVKISDGRLVVPWHGRFYVVQATAEKVADPVLMSTFPIKPEVILPNEYRLGRLYALPGNKVLVPTPSKGVFVARVEGDKLQAERNLLAEGGELVTVDNEGRLYLASQQAGLWALDQKAERMHYTTQNGLPLNYVTALTTDYEGNVWVGTFGGGAMRLIGPHMQWLRPANGLPTAQITTLYTDSRDRIWMGTPEGLCYLQGSQVVKPQGPQLLKNVRAFSETREGQMRVGTFQESVGPFAPRAVPYQVYGERLQVPSGVSSFAYGPSGLLYMGTYGAGIIQLGDTQRLRFTTSNGLPSNMVEELLPSRSGLWACTPAGLCHITPTGMKVYSRKQGLPADRVYAVYEQDDSTVWLGTDRGLARIRNGGVEAVAGAEALAGSRVLAVFDVPPASGSEAFSGLFAVTDRYLHHIETGRLITYGSLDLLPARGMTINRVAYIPQTRLVALATNQGLVILDLSKARPQTRPPLVHIDQLRTDADTFTLTGDMLELPYAARSFTIRFAGLSFSSEDAVQFRYRMQETDADWSAPTPDREVNYRNLWPGKYTFLVEALNADGVGSRNTAVLRLRLLPPWWLAWWALVLFAALFVGSIVLVVRYLTRRKLMGRIRKLETERRVNAERERISRDLHDHVGAQLSSLLSGLELTIRQEETGEPTHVNPQVVHSLRTLQTDTRTTIGQLRETIWALQSEEVLLGLFLARVEQYAVRLFAYSRQPVFALSSAADAERKLQPTEALQVFRILQEALHNVLKHSRAAHVWLHVQEQPEGSYSIEVEDDGHGIRSETLERQEEHYGLMNMQKRARDIGATISINPRTGGGTCILVTVPKKQSS